MYSTLDFSSCYTLYNHVNSIQSGKDHIDIWIFFREKPKTIFPYRIMVEALVHSKFEWPKTFSHSPPPLLYNSSMRFRLSSNNSRKCHHLASNAWNIILQLLRILLHSHFLSKFHKNLQESMEMRSKLFISLSTRLWRV